MAETIGLAVTREPAQLWSDERIADKVQARFASDTMMFLLATAYMRQMRDDYEAVLAGLEEEKGSLCDLIEKLAAETQRLTNAGLEAAYGEEIKADEANDYYAEAERLRAENADLRTKLEAAQAEVVRRQTELFELRKKRRSGEPQRRRV